MQIIAVLKYKIARLDLKGKTTLLHNNYTHKLVYSIKGFAVLSKLWPIDKCFSAKNITAIWMIELSWKKWKCVFFIYNGSNINQMIVKRALSNKQYFTWQVPVFNHLCPIRKTILALLFFILMITCQDEVQEFNGKHFAERRPWELDHRYPKMTFSKRSFDSISCFVSFCRQLALQPKWILNIFSKSHHPTSDSAKWNSLVCSEQSK